MGGSAFDISSHSVVVDENSTYLNFDFAGDAGQDIRGSQEPGGSATITPSGTINGEFTYSGFLTDGEGNLNIGYAGENSWTNQIHRVLLQNIYLNHRSHQQIHL